jgi:hypothetical protein
MSKLNVGIKCFNWAWLVGLNWWGFVTTPLWGKCEVTTHTLENGTWESSRTPKNSERDCRGQNTSHWGILYIVEKVLKCKCPKWPHMSHLDIYSTSYGRKKGRESNWQFDSWPLKVENRPNPDSYRWNATYRWKALNESYNFDLDLVPIQAQSKKLWTPKVLGVQTGTVSRFHFGSPEKKNHLDANAAESCKEYYMGEGGGFSPSLGRGESSESKVARGLSQHWKCAEWVLTNLLVGFKCRTK